MNTDARHTRRTCRLFVLTVLATLILAFLMVIGLVHPPLASQQRHTPESARTHSR